MIEGYSAIDPSMIVDRYGKNKEIEKELKKELAVDNENIKIMLSNLNSNSFSTDNYVAKLSKSVSEKFDDELLLDAIKDYWVNHYGSMHCDLIATKEYVDMDKLESALYNGEIPKELISIIASCKIKTETERLNIRRVK